LTLPKNFAIITLEVKGTAINSPEKKKKALDNPEKICYNKYIRKQEKESFSLFSSTGLNACIKISRTK